MVNTLLFLDFALMLFSSASAGSEIPRCHDPENRSTRCYCLSSFSFRYCFSRRLLFSAPLFCAVGKLISISGKSRFLGLKNNRAPPAGTGGARRHSSEQPHPVPEEELMRRVTFAPSPSSPRHRPPRRLRSFRYPVPPSKCGYDVPPIP